MLKAEFQTQTNAWPGKAGAEYPHTGKARPAVAIKSRSQITATDPEMREQMKQEMIRQLHELAHRLTTEAMERNTRIRAEYIERCIENNITPVFN